jgi:uncharacterized membrane protein HdeD (DUF308 family)
MKEDNSAEFTEQVPSIPRYIIGIFVGVVSLLLGAFFLTEPTWLRILVTVLGVIQLIISGFHTRQVIQYLGSK